MTVTFTNNFTNILNKLRNTLRTEFKGTLPVYIASSLSAAAKSASIYFTLCEFFKYPFNEKYFVYL